MCIRDSFYFLQPPHGPTSKALPGFDRGKARFDDGGSSLELSFAFLAGEGFAHGHHHSVVRTDLNGPSLWLPGALCHHRAVLTPAAIHAYGLASPIFLPDKNQGLLLRANAHVPQSIVMEIGTVVGFILFWRALGQGGHHRKALGLCACDISGRSVTGVGHSS